jgi:uncharacterized protein YjbI with pentapeptide repeats
MRYDIRDRFEKFVIASVEAESFKLAIESLLKRRVNLARADLSRTNLTAVNFYGANLTHCDFSHTDLSSCNFYAADMRGADLSHANCSSCDFSGVDLSGANLTGTDLTQTDMTGALMPAQTRLAA